MLHKSNPAVSTPWNGLKQVTYSDNYTSTCFTPQAFLAATVSPQTRLANAGTIDYENGKDHFNPCTHLKDRLVVDPLGAPVSWCTKVTTVRRITTWLTGSTYTLTKPILPSAIEITSEMRREAWAELVPQLNDGFSLANFLLELRDFGSLIKQGRKLAKQAATLNRSLFGTRTAAELILTYSFAIKPMESDLRAICKFLYNTDKAVNEFIDKGKKVQPYHFRKVLEVSDSKHATLSYGEVRNTYKAVYAATLSARYEYKKPPELEAFLRVMGLRLTPEVIWNAIPFSFVVDWMLRVGDYLRQYDVDPNLKVHVLDYCDSVKQTAVRKELRTTTGSAAGCRVSGNTLSNLGFDEADRKVWEHTYSRYVRTPGHPDTGYAFPVFDSLSTRELVLGGALLRAQF